jgi:hypothetical protein
MATATTGTVAEERFYGGVGQDILENHFNFLSWFNGRSVFISNTSLNTRNSKYAKVF